MPNDKSNIAAVAEDADRRATRAAIHPYPDGSANLFRISVVRSGHLLDLERLAISPGSAAALDQEAFLWFAAEVARVAETLEDRKAQLRLFA